MDSTKALNEKALEAAMFAAANYRNSGCSHYRLASKVVRAYAAALSAQEEVTQPAAEEGDWIVPDGTIFNRRKTMPKLTSKIALDLVTRIETLKDQIHAVYREANEYDGINNANVILDIVNAREAASDSKLEAESLLAALDEPGEDEAAS